MTVSTEAVDGVQTTRVPDFFVVGHPKSGTTALYEMLRSHPQIFMPDLKEPWFLAEDMRQRFQPSRSGEVPDTLGRYLALFAPAGEHQIAGEASSSYLTSRVAAARIAGLRPDARAIAIVREPAEFLRSLHEQLLRDHIETERDLGRALALEPERRRGRRIPRHSHLPQMLLYSDHVRYAEQLRRYIEALGEDRLLVLVYEDFRTDNEATLRRVQEFLGVEERPLATVETNLSDRRMRSQRLDDLLTGVAVGRNPAARVAKRAIKQVLPPEQRASAMRRLRRRLVFDELPPADQSVMREVRNRFRGEVQALSDLLGRDMLALWGYER
jgi:Sulfotransferase family